MNVLLIEDDDDTALALEMLLVHAGFRTRWARDGFEALAMVDACRDGRAPAPAVMLLDLRLPDVSAPELVNAIAARIPLPAIVLHSAAPQRDMEEAGARLGAVAAVRKPADGRTLIRAIRDAMNQRPALAHRA